MCTFFVQNSLYFGLFNKSLYENFFIEYQMEQTIPNTIRRLQNVWNVILIEMILYESSGSDQIKPKYF